MTNPLDPGFSIQELRQAMNLYNLPGSADMQSIEDFRGDGIDGDTYEHQLGAEQFAAEMLGIDVIGVDNFGEDDPMWDGLSADELIALGWDPFKAIKKTVKSAVKTVSKGVKTVGKVHKAITGVVINPLAKIVSQVPVVGKLGATALRAAQTAANPLAILTPRTLIKSQLNVAKAALPVAKQLVKSPLVKTVVGGAAIVFPPIGVPAAAALATAAAIAAAVDSKAPGVRQAALQIVQNTTKLARSGDKGAEIALSQITTQKQALTAKKLASPASGAKRLVFDVHPGGRISRIAV
jgi:hypothetical protein